MYGTSLVHLLPGQGQKDWKYEPRGRMFVVRCEAYRNMYNRTTDTSNTKPLATGMAGVPVASNRLSSSGGVVLVRIVCTQTAASNRDPSPCCVTRAVQTDPSDTLTGLLVSKITKGDDVLSVYSLGVDDVIAGKDARSLNMAVEKRSVAADGDAKPPPLCSESTRVDQLYEEGGVQVASPRRWRSNGEPSLNPLSYTPTKSASTMRVT